MITLICPTYNRQHLLPILFSKYLSSDLELVVVDGSPSVFLPGNLYPTHKYFHLPEQSLIDRVLFGAKVASGSYSALISDDDHHFSVFLHNYIPHNDEDPAPTAYVGLVSTFAEQIGKLGIPAVAPYSRHAFKLLSNPSYAALPLGLTRKYFSSYEPLLVWAVVSTSCFIEAIKCAKKFSELQLYGLLEHVISLYILLNATINALPVPQLIRIEHELSVPSNDDICLSSLLIENRRDLFSIYNGECPGLSIDLLTSRLTDIFLSSMTSQSHELLYDLIRYSLIRLGTPQYLHRRRFSLFDRIRHGIIKVLFSFLFLFAFVDPGRRQLYFSLYLHLSLYPRLFLKYPRYYSATVVEFSTHLKLVS